MHKVEENGQKISFKQAIIDFFRGYVDFGGRTTRGGYWWVELAGFLAGLIFVIISEIACFASDEVCGAIIIILCICSFAVILPSITVWVRRLRDVGYSNLGICILAFVPLFTYILAIAIPPLIFLVLIFNILVLITLMLPSDYHTGKFGPLTRK